MALCVRHTPSLSIEISHRVNLLIKFIKNTHFIKKIKMYQAEMQKKKINFYYKSLIKL